MSGDHTKALIGQLIIFNQILGELREDIREQVRDGERMRGGRGPGGMKEREGRRQGVCGEGVTG